VYEGRIEGCNTSMPASRLSSDPERPLKHHEIRFWFDNPDYCISPSVTPVSSPIASVVQRQLVPSNGDSRDECMNSCPAKEDPSTRINDKIMNLISARPPNGLVGLTERLSAKRPQLPEPQPHDLDVSASRESSTAVYSRMSAVSTRPSSPRRMRSSASSHRASRAASREILAASRESCGPASRTSTPHRLRMSVAAARQHEPIESGPTRHETSNSSMTKQILACATDRMASERRGSSAFTPSTSRVSLLAASSPGLESPLASRTSRASLGTLKPLPVKQPSFDKLNECSPIPLPFALPSWKNEVFGKDVRPRDHYETAGKLDQFLKPTLRTEAAAKIRPTTRRRFLGGNIPAAPVSTPRDPRIR
jgi:hypothetical protein